MARNSESSTGADYQPLFNPSNPEKGNTKRFSSLIASFSVFILVIAFSGWFGFRNSTFPTSSNLITKGPSDVRQFGELKLVEGAWIEPDLISPPPTPGARLTKVRYGPWKVPPKTLTENMINRDIAKPCENCIIVAFQKSLEYADGTIANLDTGAYLHHDIQFNRGEPDTLCSRLMGERFTTSGNERWVRRFNAHGNWGYHFKGANKTWGAATRLQNLGDEEQEIYLTITYEWMPIGSPEAKGYRNVKALWLDIAPLCGNAEVPAIKGKMTYNSKAWASTIRGHILDAGGHAHSGGLGMSVYKNAKELCYSKQIYGNTNGHEKEEGWVDENGKEYISNVGVCQNLGWLEIGDALTMDASYDSDLYDLNEKDGVLEPVMGVMGLYIGE